VRPLLLLLAVLVAGCADRPAVSQIHRGIIDNVFPAETLRDWKSLADHVAVVTAVDEKALREGPLRHVWLRVDRVLWSGAHAPQLPPVFSVRTWGWDEDGVPLKEEEAARFTLQHSYVVPLVRYDELSETPEWAPLADLAIMPLRDGRIDTRGVLAGDAQRRLEGTTVQEATRIVRDQVPHPIARRFRHLRPRARMEEMLQGGAFRD
jgi:hypothetical protein